MDEGLKTLLKEWAAKYHNKAFIRNDPVQFPHRYQSKQDIEISGLLTALISFGNRKMIIRKAEELDRIMESSPYQYLLSRKWDSDFPVGNKDSFYRMLSFADFHGYMQKLYDAYLQYDSLEDALAVFAGSPMERICTFLSVSSKSPQKKLNMFLRWMIRRNSDVDFGIWQSFSPSDLIIPLDTHVCRMACTLGLTDSLTFSLKNARRITRALSEVFPNDPCMGDFALFGYGVSQSRVTSTGQWSEP